MLRVHLIGAVSAAVLMANSAQAADEALRDRLASVSKGAALAQRNCGMCHAIGARGASPNPQAPPFRNLGERFDVDALGEGLAQGILTDHPAMPEFRFEAHEVVSIILYLKSIQAKQRVREDAAGAVRYVAD